MGGTKYGTAADYLKAFRVVREQPHVDHYFRLLQAHFNAAGHCTTWADLAKVVNYATGAGVNLQYGLFAERVARALKLKEKPHGFWLNVLADWADEDDPESGHTAFVLRPEVVDAVRRLGLVSGSRYWTCHWQFRHWHGNPAGRPLRSSGSNSFRKRRVTVNDKLYIVSIHDGQLYLGGRLTVAEIIDREKATRRLQTTSLFEATEWAIAAMRSGTPFDPDRRLAPALSERIRFDASGGPKALAFSSSTELDNQATRGVRPLTREAAALLDRILAVTDQQTKPGGVYTVSEATVRRAGATIDAERKKLPPGAPAEDYSEGRVYQRMVRQYERSRTARQACLRVHGYTCAACQMDFAGRYGAATRTLIHVHHKHPLAVSSGERKTDPTKDLCPLCPNCHAVVHQGGGCRKIEDVKRMLRTKRAR